MGCQNQLSKSIVLGLLLALTIHAFPQDTIRVKAGLNQLSLTCDTIQSGDVIMLISSGGEYEESTTLIIDKNISIISASNLKQKPVWTNRDGGYLIRTKAGLRLTGISLYGTNDSLTSKGGISIDSTGYTVSITNCEFINFNNDSLQEGYGISNLEYQGKVDSLLVSNCIFKNILIDGISISTDSISNSSAVKYLLVNNSTFSELYGKAIFLHSNDELNTEPVNALLIDHCTFVVPSNSSAIVTKQGDSITVKNCIAHSLSETGGIAFDLDGNMVILKNSIYFNLGISINGRISNCKSVDPLFFEAEYGNYMLYKNSPAIQAGDDGSTLGDPRWGISPYLSTELLLVKEPYSLSPTTNSVRIVWETPERRSTQSIVEYGTTEQLGKKTMGDDGWFVSGEGYIHEVTISGLQPFTPYYYRVSDGEKQGLQTNSTKTAPIKGTDFRIMAISDTHDNSGKIWQVLSKRAVQDTLDMTVYIGDLVSNGNIRTTWNNGFFIPGEPLLSKCVSIYAMGNHDTNHGPTTALDYFSLPVHPENGDAPESYYSMDYGDVKMIVLNLTEDAISPSFQSGSPQYIWLDNELQNASTKWIFVYTHVNLLSTGMHSQWSANHKKYILPLLEKYAIEGKHILVIGGHEHNFEHLYKNGINHIRAGCANIIRRDQYTTVDIPYSKCFKNTAGYSTFDVSDSGNVVLLQARDSTGAVFYTAKFDARDNFDPAIYLNEPNGFNDSTSTSYPIRWADSDPDNNASISLYYTTDSMSIENGVMITDSIKEDDPVNSYQWDVGNIPPDSYYICAVINDSINEPVYSFSKGKITVVADSISPVSAVNLEGEYVHEKVLLNWENPGGMVPYEKMLADFEDSADEFMVQSTDSTLLERIPNEQGNALRIHYKIPNASVPFSTIQQFSGYPDFCKGQLINFWFKGDSTQTKMQFIVRQDNDRNGLSDDWWCTDTLSLASNNWQQVTIPFDSLTTYPTHPNLKSKFDGENMLSFDYIISVALPDSGYVDIDSVKITGENPFAPDFKGVGLFRRNDRYPESWNDGDLVYKGDATSCIDSAINFGNKYYYTLLAYDYQSNYSIPGTSAFWESDILLNNNQLLYNKGNQLDQNYPNPFNQSTTINYTLAKSGKVKIEIFNLSGQKLTTLFIGFVDEGEHSVVLNPLQSGIQSAGTYYYRIETSDFNSAKKMIFVQ